MHACAGCMLARTRRRGHESDDVALRSTERLRSPDLQSHSAVGLLVTAILSIRLRAWSRITRPYSSLKDMVRTTNRSIEAIRQPDYAGTFSSSATAVWAILSCIGQRSTRRLLSQASTVRRESAALPTTDSPGSFGGSAHGVRHRSSVCRCAAKTSSASRRGSLVYASGARSPA